MFEFDRNKQTITIEGNIFDPNIFIKNKLPEFLFNSFKRDLFLFLQDWFSDSPLLKVQTSGSTGIPKEMYVEKQRMMHSASLTCSFLGLKKNDTALLCMPLNYIAGKMMVVRALIAGLDVYPITPSGNPLAHTAIAFDFAAMVPLQVYNSLQSDAETERLKNIKNLIIGGDAVNASLEKELKSFPNKVYSTYGMTETLSHIALRKLNGSDASERYIPLNEVSISLSDNNALIINAPLVAVQTLYTNDVAETFNDNSFRIIGRTNNIINSGGIKIQIEEVEKLLKPLIKGLFAITSIPHPKFGEIIVLATEEDLDELLINENLPDYYRPKRIFKIKSIPLTETGKINRLALKEIVSSIIL